MILKKLKRTNFEKPKATMIAALVDYIFAEKDEYGNDKRLIQERTVINDAPIVLDPSETGFKKWNPKNFSGKFSGPIMMKDALKKSLNLVSIRILQAITPRYAVDFIQRFAW